MKYYNNGTKYNLKIVLAVIIAVIVLLLVFTGEEPVPIEQSAIELGHDALRMLEAALASRKRIDIVESLLVGIGYIVSISAPAAIVVYFLKTGKRKTDAGNDA